MLYYKNVMGKTWVSLAGVAGLAYFTGFLILGPDVSPQTWEPGEIASHLIAGEGYSMHSFSGTVQPSANQEPVYPLILAFFLGWVPRPYVLLMVFQVGFWLAASLVLARLSHRLVGAPEKATALVVALWPPMMVYVLMVHPLWLRTVIMIFVLAAVVAYRDAPGWGRAVVLGVVFGLAALIRATFLILPFLILPWILPPGMRRERKVVTQMAVALVLAALVHSPWLIRNRIVLDAWVPGTTTAGYIALMGNRPGAVGSLDSDARNRTYAEFPSTFWRQPEPVRDAELKRRVLSFWKEHPVGAIALYVKKLLYLWTWRPGVGGLYPRAWTFLYYALWGITLPAVLVGWWLARRNPEAEAPGLFLWIWTSYSLVYAFFAVNMRYRFETEPLLVPYALVALSTSWNGLRARWSKT
jgi:hypothetical protein